MRLQAWRASVIDFPAVLLTIAMGSHVITACALLRGIGFGRRRWRQCDSAREGGEEGGES